ncbi:MAG: hypothetical protein CMF50_02245 [Legionellales bacterium]|nr:hypothetical protein [Legionellales bacterium]|tara:strand:- start:26262 stop:27101 length:840 start_codon:yes stop_codon:yes gene_type:complete
MNDIVLHLILYVLSGASVGFLAGLLGVGGGILVVPILVLLLPGVGVPPQHLMHVAVATSLAVIVGTSLSSIYAHNKRGGILWERVKQLLPGLILGAVIGASVVDLLPSDALRIFFGVFMFVMAFNITFDGSFIKMKDMPSTHKLWGYGTFIATCATLLGVGGGSLTVPFLSSRKVPIRNAVATSAVCGFPIALVGSIGMIIAGSNESGLPPHTLGYIFLPAFIGIVIPSIFMAPLGAKIAHKLPTKILRMIFAVFLILVGADMLNKSFVSGWNWIMMHV